MRTSYIEMKIRLEAELMTRVRQEAKREHRSTTAQIAWMLERAMDKAADE